jgi:hypothetical protein
MKKQVPTTTFRIRGRCVAFALLTLFLSSCRQVDAASASSTRPRDMELPAFIPAQIRSFDCPLSSSLPKPSDPQAKAWYDEAIALRKFSARTDIDWKRIEWLMQQAATRHYWPAVRKNIGKLYGEQQLALIEQAVSAEEPEAFFMMGELYVKGNGVEVNQAKAYAFWQRAAMMGDVRAMVELAVVLSTKQNSTIGWNMVNIPVATAMLECAMKKGHGDAAVPLRDIVSRPRKHDGSFAENVDNAANDVAEAQGLTVLQEGVKLGSRMAASELATYFLIQHQFKAQDSSNPRLYSSSDALRARYYQYLEHSLDKETPELLPSLDTAVPLPPARLPDWRDKDDNIAGLWEAATALSAETIAKAAKLAK